MKFHRLAFVLFLIHSGAFSQDLFKIQCPDKVSKGDSNVSASAPTGLTNPALAYQWTISNPSGGSSTIAALTQPTNTATVKFDALAPGIFNLVCTYGTNAPVSKQIEILPDPNLQIVVPAKLDRGSKGNVAKIIEPATGGCPNLRYEWLPGQGIKLNVSSSITNTLMFDVEDTSLSQIKLTAKVANPAGKVFTTASASITLVDPPKSSIMVRKPIVTVGDTGLFASVPSTPGSTYNWTINGGQITSGQNQYAVWYKATSVGDLILYCQVTNSAGTSSLSQSAQVKVLPMPDASIVATAAEPTKLGEKYTALALPQAGVKYFWEVPFGLGVILSGQNEPIMHYMFTGPSGTSASISLTVTNEAGKSVTGHKQFNIPQMDNSVSFGTNRPLLHKRTYTVTTTAATSTPPPVYKWIIKKIKSGGEEETQKETGAAIEVAADGDLLTPVSISCLVSGSSRFGSAIIMPNADATITAPRQVTIGVPFAVSTKAPQNYSTKFLLEKDDGKKWSVNTLGVKEASLTVGSGPTGTMTLTATSMVSCGIITPGIGDDTKSMTIELLPAPAISQFTILDGYGRYKSTNSWYVSRGAMALVTPVFSNGTGSISGIVGPIVSGQSYSTPNIWQETTLELTVDNGAGGVAKQSITLVPVAPDLEVRFITINQGVERYLDQDDQINGTYNNSTFPQDFWKAQAWKKDVPLIAGRPARFTVHMLTQGTAIPFGTAPTAKNKLTLVLSNPGKDPVEIQMNTATFTAPTVGTSFGESDPTKVAQFDVTDSADLTDQTSFQVKVTIDPTLGIDASMGVINPYNSPQHLYLSKLPAVFQFIMVPVNLLGSNIAPWTDDEINRAKKSAEDAITAICPVADSGGISFGITPAMSINFARESWAIRQILYNNTFKTIVASNPNVYAIAMVKRDITTNESNVGISHRGERYIAMYFNYGLTPSDYPISEEQLTLVHELGHCFGLWHAPYQWGQFLSKAPGIGKIHEYWWNNLQKQASPYLFANTGVKGITIRPALGNSLFQVHSPKKKDIMSYEFCNNSWISDYMFQIYHTKIVSGRSLESFVQMP